MSLDFLGNSPILGSVLQGIGLVDDPEEVRAKRRREGQALADARAFQQFYQDFNFDTPTAAQLLQDYGYKSAGGAMGEDYLMRLLGGEFDTYSGWGMPAELSDIAAQDQADALALMEQYRAADTPVISGAPSQPKYQWEEYVDPYEESWLGKAEKFYETASSGDFQDISRNMYDEREERRQESNAWREEREKRREEEQREGGA